MASFKGFYDRTYWLDHVVDQSGEVIQQGTLMDQAHFNNMEKGIAENAETLSHLLFMLMQDEYNNQNELHVLDLSMNASEPWPHNNKDTTVALETMRESINYSVEVDVLQYSGGQLGDIRVLDRARNGFKLRHEGSAKQVQVAVRVSGGMEDPLLDEDEIEEPEYTTLNEEG